MSVKPFFSISIDYSDTGGRVLPQPRSATPEEKAARKARDIAAGAQGREERAAKYAAQQAERERAKRAYAKPKANNKRGIVWGGSSDCFDELVYSASARGVFGSFIGPASGVWFFPCSRSEAEEFLIENGNAPGSYFNSSGLREIGE